MAAFSPKPMQPIAFVRSPYRQKFAIPRQPNLVREAVGEIWFEQAFADPNCLRGLEGFTHLWLLFLFHETADKSWSATVTPPRLGGNERVGVFATRSPYRPNPIGLSVVENVAILQHGKQLCLRVRGIDLLDGTPVLDIKPYVPYVDRIPEARGGYAEQAPSTNSKSDFTVKFSHNSLIDIDNINFELCNLKDFIENVLKQDPRPAQHVRKGEAREYAMHLYDFNIRWQASDNCIEVISVEPLDPAAGVLPWQL